MNQIERIKKIGKNSGFSDLKSKINISNGIEFDHKNDFNIDLSNLNSNLSSDLKNL